MTPDKPTGSILMVHESQPLSYALGNTYADFLEDLGRKNASPGAWPSQGVAMTAHIDALAQTMAQAINVIAALEAEIQQLKAARE